MLIAKLIQKCNMILGIGTDIIEVERVRKAIARQGFKEKVFSEREIAYCDKEERGERYAARYAAKEAFSKAMGTGWAADVDIHSVEIINDEKGKPNIILSGKALDLFTGLGGIRIHVSLSHIKETALAFVVIEGR